MDEVYSEQQREQLLNLMILLEECDEEPIILDLEYYRFFVSFLNSSYKIELLDKTNHKTMLMAETAFKGWKTMISYDFYGLDGEKMSWIDFFLEIGKNKADECAKKGRKNTDDMTSHFEKLVEKMGK